MPKKPRSKSPKGKRGPKEERLVITDPQAALTKLLKPTTPKP
ncbi:MAG: hypothetical protein WBW84_01940 [Acidobacteriaceae bacterium]